MTTFNQALLERPSFHGPLLDKTIVLASIDHDLDFFQDLVNIFLEDSPPVYREIGHHIAREDWETVSTKAHLLLGMSLTIGACRLAAVCASLEEAPQSPCLFEVLKETYRATISTLTTGSGTG